MRFYVSVSVLFAPCTYNVIHRHNNTNKINYQQYALQANIRLFMKKMKSKLFRRKMSSNALNSTPNSPPRERASKLAGKLADRWPICLTSVNSTNVIHFAHVNVERSVDTSHSLSTLFAETYRFALFQPPATNGCVE